jgi:hypothetical protein
MFAPSLQEKASGVVHPWAASCGGLEESPESRWKSWVVQSGSDVFSIRSNTQFRCGLISHFVLVRFETGKGSGLAGLGFDGGLL